MRALETRRPTFRWHDFVALPEDDRRELVDGRLEELEMPTKWHEFIVAFLIRTIGTWAEKKGGLVVLGSGYRLRVSDRRGAMPDVQVLTEEAYDAAGANGLEHGRPELVIEVLLPSSRAHDGLRKLDWYASLGVPEFWLVDAETRSVVCHRLTGATYTIAEHPQGDVVFKPKSMPGLKLPLAKAWAKVPKE